MASSGSSPLVPAKHNTTISSTSATKCSHLAGSPAALPASTTALPASPAGMGFSSLPPLPIISQPFGFLKSVDLRIVGLDLCDVPVKSRWELVLFKPIVEQPRSEDVFESKLEFGDWGTESESVPNVSGFETGAELVSDVGQDEPEPSPVFEDFLGSSFDNLDRVADVESDEEPQSPIEIIQTKLIQIPQSGEGHRTKRVKTPAGRTYLPLVRKMLGMQAKSSTSPSQPKSSSPKSTAKPSRKYFRLASKSTSKLPKSATPIEQEPILIEEIGSSAEKTLDKEAGEAPAKQGSTLVPSSKPSPKREHTARKTTTSTLVPKRKASTK